MDHKRQTLGFWELFLLIGWVGASPVLASDPPTRVSSVKSVGKEAPRGRVEGVASPGSRIRLCLDQPARAGSRFYWVQNAGPSIDVDGQAGAELKLTVPIGAESLGFLLAISDDQGLQTVDFQIPIVNRPAESASTPPLPQATGPRADAGDDTIGLVGRRVTLNGSESRPKDGLSYRWIQVDGPQMVGLDEAGRFCSFVPSAPGNYRFALVVALDNRISTADFVVVSVGTPPGPPPGASPMPLTLTGLNNPPPSPSMMPSLSALTPLDAAVNQALATLDDAPMVAGPLAEVFQAAALRMDLYRTYGEIFSEISRRLDAVVPADPVRRSRWNALLFEPLTAQTVASLLPVGLDLRVAGSQDALLTSLQKQELRVLFERLARRLAPVRPSR
jgi:hypothetical protein